MSQANTVVEVRLFARARELADSASVQVSLPPQADVAQLRTQLGAQFPNLSELLRHCAIAVNHTYTGDQTSIADGDEIALIPPVAGG